jgi:hypothetical protein
VPAPRKWVMRLNREQQKRAGRSAERRSCLCLPSRCASSAPSTTGGRHADRLRGVGGGTVYLLHPLTRPAHDWIAEHLPSDAMRLGDAVAVEWRHIGEVVGGASCDGLQVR